MGEIVANAWKDNEVCAVCKKRDYLTPLHGDKGGPWCCLLCKGEWHGKHGRRRRLGRILIRAMTAYLNGGGSWGDVDKLRLSASCGASFFGFDLDPLGYLADTASTGDEVVDLTSELLTDAIKIAHPDLHPPERRELAQRVTAGLLALQPFVFPAPKPKPAWPAAPEPRNGSLAGPGPDRQKAVTFPCKECADSIPCFYCTPCRSEFDKRNQVERDRESANRRARRAERRAARTARSAACGTKFKGKRKDARYCSDACRQQGHRNSVTDKRTVAVDSTPSRDRRPTP
jgi:hypothetical protein